MSFMWEEVFRTVSTGAFLLYRDASTPRCSRPPARRANGARPGRDGEGLSPNSKRGGEARACQRPRSTLHFRDETKLRTMRSARFSLDGRVPAGAGAVSGRLELYNVLYPLETKGSTKGSTKGWHWRIGYWLRLIRRHLRFAFLAGTTWAAAPRCPSPTRACEAPVYDSHPLPDTRCRARRDSLTACSAEAVKPVNRHYLNDQVLASPLLGCPCGPAGTRPAHSSPHFPPPCAPCPPARAPLTECRPHPLWYRRAMENKLEKMHPTNKPRGGNLQARQLGSLVTTLSREREPCRGHVWLFNTASG